MIIELWRGKSEIDGSSIVLLANMASHNNKIGAGMVATYIWSADMLPSAARGRGGMCPADCPALEFCMNNDYPGAMAYDKSWSKQVLASKAVKVPRSNWRAFLRGRSIRFGVDGDGGALPLSVIQGMVKASGRPVADHTAYTHFHERTELNFLFMASCESLSQVPSLEAAGWKCFISIGVPGWSGYHKTFSADHVAYLRRTIRAGIAEHAIKSPVVVCPNYLTGVQCAQCLLCNRERGRAHIVAPVHGQAGVKLVNRLQVIQ